MEKLNQLTQEKSF